jgi:hypothetical protein
VVIRKLIQDELTKQPIKAHHAYKNHLRRFNGSAMEELCGSHPLDAAPHRRKREGKDLRATMYLR